MVNSWSKVVYGLSDHFFDEKELPKVEMMEMATVSTKDGLAYGQGGWRRKK